jgi:hypothetical protein
MPRQPGQEVEVGQVHAEDRTVLVTLDRSFGEKGRDALSMECGYQDIDVSHGAICAIDRGGCPGEHCPGYVGMVQPAGDIGKSDPC